MPAGFHTSATLKTSGQGGFRSGRPAQVESQKPFRGSGDLTPRNLRLTDVSLARGGGMDCGDQLVRVA